ncbi:MAG TPA: Uma2 family endonuclease [Pirellulales bacterium]|nr:Uma2 family endonuclease [Pirellulales bacterium]
MTADELFWRPDDNLRHELVKGEITTMTPAGFEHGEIIMELATRMRIHVKQRRLGSVLSSDTGFILSRDPDTVRAPDVSFVVASRIERIGSPKTFFPGAPDLAVEVVSPNDRVNELDEKVQEYLAAGSQEVWVINPKTRTATVYRNDGTVAVLTERDALNGGSLIPGFTCAVADIFPTPS